MPVPQSIWIPVVVFATCTVPAIAFLSLRDFVRRCRRDNRSATDPEFLPLPPSKAKKNTASSWVWLLIIPSIGFFTWILGPDPRNPGPRVPALLLVLIIPFGVIIAWILMIAGQMFFLWLRIRDPVWSRCCKRANEGDIDGAIRELREAMEAQGPTPARMNNLGILYLSKDADEEALECFLEAETLDRRGTVKLIQDGTWFELSKAVCLRKLGRLEEALHLIEEAVARHPGEAGLLQNYALILADLGRYPEAREQLRRLDALPKVRYLSKAQKAADEKSLQDTRDRIEAPPDKVPIDIDDLA